MVERRLSAWLRSALALFGIAGILLLAGCGGGSGAPNNPYLPPPPVIPPLTLLPSTLFIYPGTPATLTISGGVPPYRAFSSDASILPVPALVGGDTVVLVANPVTANTVVAITVQDSTATVSAPATISVRPAALLASGITITSNPNPACTVGPATLCSGGTGTATVQVTGNGGAGVGGRAVKFEVVQGSFSIVSTNPAQPLVSTLTVTTDSTGSATVVLSVPANTPTQSGIIRATDVASGNQITGNFVIQQITVGGQTLAVLPLGNTTINGPDNTQCSSGVTVTNYIFGGTPPYHVAVNFPQYVTLSPMTVLTSGGSFNTTTNGSCFINLTYVITDATGLTIPAGLYPTVTNQLGTNPPAPPPPGPFTATPGAIAKNNCVPANTFQFVMTGGVAPYSVVTTSTTSPTSPVLAPQTGVTAGAAVTVSGLTSPSNTTITGFDSSVPPQAVTVSISCSGTAPPPSGSALAITPPNYTYTSCVAQTSNFVIVGGTPPYTVGFVTPRPGATITPTTVPPSGPPFVPPFGFSVTGLTDGVQTTNISVADSSAPPLQQIVTITCPVAPPPVALVITPSSYTYSGGAACSAAVSQFVITGGNGTYTVPSTTVPAGGTVTRNGNQFTVLGLPSSPLPQTYQVTVQDTATPPQSKPVSITCNP